MFISNGYYRTPTSEIYGVLKYLQLLLNDLIIHAKGLYLVIFNRLL